MCINKFKKFLIVNGLQCNGIMDLPVAAHVHKYYGGISLVIRITSMNHTYHEMVQSLRSSTSQNKTNRNRYKMGNKNNEKCKKKKNQHTKLTECKNKTTKINT